MAVAEAGHLAAVRAAGGTSQGLLAIFRRIGVDAPGGEVISAYRTAIAALRGNLGNLAIVRDVLQTLRMALRGIFEQALREAWALGHGQGVAEMRAYGDTPRSAPETGVLDALRAVDAQVDAQVAAVTAAAAAGMGEGAILGDGEGPAMLWPTVILREGARWLRAAATRSWWETVGGDTAGGPTLVYVKQAIATIDARTTDCCLRVHGQVVGMDEDFHLVGVPRYADRLPWSPFHDWCRTSPALVLRELADDDLTARMRAAAAAELARRAEIYAHIEELKAQLVELGTYPDVRIRKSDTAEIIGIRNELRYWREQLIAGAPEPSTGLGG